MIDIIFPLVLELFKKFADGAIDGKMVCSKPDLKEGVQFAYCALQIYGDNLEVLIKGEYDDKLIKEFISFIEDTAEEGGFPLPRLSMGVEKVFGTPVYDHEDVNPIEPADPTVGM